MLPFKGLQDIHLHAQYPHFITLITRVLIIKMKINYVFTWSVGNRWKSSGGFVMTYRLLDASKELDVSRNLYKKDHC
jgi:hypothetical protein